MFVDIAMKVIEVEFYFMFIIEVIVGDGGVLEYITLTGVPDILPLL